MPKIEHDFGDIAQRIRRVALAYRWRMIGTACGVAVATAVVVQFLPKSYRSEAALASVQQQVSSRYVDPSGPQQNPAEVVNSMTRVVLSRSRLLGIIDEFGLYKKARKSMPPEELAEYFRKEVAIEPLDQVPGRTDFTTFKLAFTAESPELANAVTTRLTSLFIEENKKQQGQQAVATNTFLLNQMRTAQQRVAQQEARLQGFKSQNLEQLPEQQLTNQGKLGDLRLQLQNNAANISRAQQQQATLEQQRFALESSLAVTINRLQSERTILLGRFTPKHPEVLKKDDEIAKAQAVLARVKARTPRTDASPITLPEEATAAQLDTQVAANNAEINNLNQEDARLKAEIEQFQNRISFAPIREQQMVAIQSELEQARKDYADVKGKQTQSEMTAKVQENNEGEHFRIVDPPTFPMKPTSPKVMQISAGGLGAGILFALILAFLLDRQDTSYYSENDLKVNFPLPLVVAIPMIPTPSEEKARAKRNIMEWIAASASAAAVLAVEFYVYLHR